MPKLLLAAALIALALPDMASAALTVARAQTVVTRGATPVTVPEAGTFHLVGVHWRGTGTVQLRTHAVGGRWSAWRPAAPEAEDGPDRGSAEGGGGRDRIGNPWWVGASDRLQLRTHGRVTWARAWTVRSPASLVPLRRQAQTTRPTIVSRAAWGADEAIRRNEPTYAPELRYAVVHHTAGANGYTKAEAPAVVRAIQRYHVQSNGWNDIGYNFLVDRFGTVYEGRYGGVEANVVGAHAVGFNTGSVGVALLGTYGTTPVAPAAERSLAALLAWRLDLAHVDPLARPLVSSGGSPKYAAGAPVVLRAVTGHRDVGLTECPGDALYARLAALAGEAARIGLPKIYEPVVETDGASVSFRARLSGALPWFVTVRDAGGAVVATGSGVGATVDWVWDTPGVPLGRYAWLIEAGSGAAVAGPASGVVEAGGAPVVLAVTDVLATPSTVTPDGDGVGDQATIAYTLTSSATVSVTAVDESGIATVVETARWRRAGAHTATFVPADLPDGRYTVMIDARDALGATATADTAVVVTRVLGAATAGPAVLSPNGDGRADGLRVAFSLARAAAVTVRVTRDGVPVVTVSRGRLAGGRHAVRWDGSKPSGRIGEGAFAVVVEARDELAAVRATLPFAVDVTPPRLQLVSRRPPRLAVGEASSLRLVVNGRTRRLVVDRGRVLAFPGTTEVRTLLVDAWDRAGNRATLRVRRP